LKRFCITYLTLFFGNNWLTTHWSYYQLI
jgi:hypothetical protein